MKVWKKLAVVALPMAILAGCADQSTENKALAEKANQAAADAKRAAAAAEAAAKEAKMAGDKADRVFQKGLRK